MIASLIIVLHLMDIIPLESAVSSLYIVGALLILAELGVISFGLIAINGVIAIYAGYALQTGSNIILGIPIGFSLLFGIVFVELFIISLIISVHLWLRKQKSITGKQAMIGGKASIIEWSDKNGSVNFEGEIWKAKSENALDLNESDEVIIKSINKLDLTINKNNS